MSQLNPEDLSRRYSIDSFSRGAGGSGVGSAPSLGNSTINVGSFNNVPSFNRFNTISENEYEEPSINQKFFQVNDNANALRRISTLQTRNKQQKPHLQSSYALEDVTSGVTETQIRGDAWNKENSSSTVGRVFIFLSHFFLNLLHSVYNPLLTNQPKIFCRSFRSRM